MTPEVEKASAIALRTLEEHARMLSRPEVRLATISRLVAACDAIESGEAAKTVSNAAGENVGRIYGRKINASSIDRYVKACKWSGPVRTTIAREPLYVDYIRARERERESMSPTRRKSQNIRDIEDALSRIDAAEDRLFLGRQIAIGRRAQAELQLLSEGLRKIPGIDVDALLAGNLASQTAPGLRSSAPEVMQHLRKLLTRLTDHAEMAVMGFEIDGNRVRQINPPHSSLVRPSEMIALRSLFSSQDV